MSPPLQVHLSPCKLMVAGEYSVLLPGGMALSVAVSPSLEIRLEESEEDGMSAPALGLERARVQPQGETRFVFMPWRL